MVSGEPAIHARIAARFSFLWKFPQKRNRIKKAGESIKNILSVDLILSFVV